MKKALSIVLCVLCLAFTAKAQELQCELRVNSAQVSGTDKTVFQNMQTALYDFINNTKFTEINFKQNEKIESFASITNDSLEEVFENKEQIEIAKFYERLPKPTLIAIHEFLHDQIYFRNPAKESQEDF